MSNLIVVLDPGHGGSDSGACSNGLMEKIINLETALSIKNTLENSGVEVVLTRDEDEFVGLSERANIANNIANTHPNNRVIFVSLHHNAGGGDRGECIYSVHGGTGREIAQAVADEMSNTLGQQEKVYSRSSSYNSNRDYYAVIRETSVPAIIVEVAFIDNSTDVEICDTYEKRVRNGQVIANGILRWNGQGVGTVNTNVQGSQCNCTSYSSDIASLQQELNIQGFTDYNGNSLNVDGIAGAKTLAACTKATLRRGANGNITRWVQAVLNAQGYDTNGIDGDFGGGTEQAVEQYQRDHGLDDDGIVGHDTWSKLLGLS